jgi:RHS repeat-associated protein
MTRLLAILLAPPALAGPPQDFYYHADDLYNVAALSDGAGGAPVERYEYADYGRPLDPATLAPVGGDPAPATQNALLFAGRRFDAELQWYQYRRRYLEPVAGRFLTRDSIGTWGDVRNLGNAQTFVGNSPLVGLDPTGEKYCCTQWKMFYERVGYKDFETCASKLLEEAAPSCSSWAAEILIGSSLTFAGAVSSVEGAPAWLSSPKVAGPLVIGSIVAGGARVVYCNSILLYTLRTCGEFECTKSYPATSARTGRWAGNPFGNLGCWYETTYSCPKGGSIVDSPDETRSVTSDEGPGTITRWE